MQGKKHLIYGKLKFFRGYNHSTKTDQTITAQEGSAIASCFIPVLPVL